MFDRVLAILDVILLIIIVAQGESIRYYERETFRMNRERFDERKKWREQKRQQVLKKDAEQKTNDSKPISESESKSTTAEPKSKSTNVESVAGLSKPMDLPTLTTTTFSLRSIAILIRSLWRTMVGKLRALMNRAG